MANRLPHVVLNLAFGCVAMSPVMRLPGPILQQVISEYVVVIACGHNLIGAQPFSGNPTPDWFGRAASQGHHSISWARSCRKIDHSFATHLST